MSPKEPMNSIPETFQSCLIDHPPAKERRETTSFLLVYLDMIQCFASFNQIKSPAFIWRMHGQVLQKIRDFFSSRKAPAKMVFLVRQKCKHKFILL